MKLTYAISNIMSKQIVSVDVGATLRDAMQQMVDNNIGSVVVTREDDIAGILTERDILKCFCADMQAAGKPAGESALSKCSCGRPAVHRSGQNASKNCDRGRRGRATRIFMVE